MIQGYDTGGDVYVANRRVLMWRYYECRAGTSFKFWLIALCEDKISYVTRYGKIGTAGAISCKTWLTPDTCKDKLFKICDQKERKGYELIEFNNTEILGSVFGFKPGSQKSTKSSVVKKKGPVQKPKEKKLRIKFRRRNKK